VAFLKNTRNIVITGVVTAAVSGLGVGLAFAAGTWTVSPGGAATAQSSKMIVKDTLTGTTITCGASRDSGTIKSGRGLPGTDIGQASPPPNFNCAGPLGLTFAGTFSHLPYLINFVSYNAATGVTTGTLTGIHATFSGAGCSFVEDGTGGTANNGRMKGTYANGSSQAKITVSGGNLHVYNVSGCAGLITNGDPLTVSGSYTISPHQTVTSP
jgi:hypothetical protein